MIEILLSLGIEKPFYTEQKNLNYFWRKVFFWEFIQKFLYQFKQHKNYGIQLFLYQRNQYWLYLRIQCMMNDMFKVGLKFIAIFNKLLFGDKIRYFRSFIAMYIAKNWKYQF